MTDYYADPVNGHDSNNGKSWEKAKLTLDGLIGSGRSKGDRLYAGPGAYRERSVLKGSGEAITVPGTVSVTQDSAIITGAGGTNWSAKLRAGDRIHIPWLASGSDGLSDFAGAFSSASETFEAGCVGFVINIWERGGANGGSYIISTIGGGNITVMVDVNVIAFPVAGVGADYEFRVPSNEGSYEIASVDSDTQITLTRPWSGPTYTGRDYTISRPIYLIGDNTGAHTDGIGGVVRITGSTSDTAADLANCIRINEVSHWVISGFQVDTTTSDNIDVTDSEYITLEDITSLNPGTNHIYFEDECDNITVRRCAMFGGDEATAVLIENTTGDIMDASCHIENIEAHCSTVLSVDDLSSVTMKNCVAGMSCDYFARTLHAYRAGQCVFVHDCPIQFCSSVGLDDNVLGQIIGDHNNYWANTADTTTAVILAPTNYEYMALPETPLLADGHRYPVRFFPPSEWWVPRGLLGLYGANQDMYGVGAPITIAKRSYGPHLDQYIARDAITTYGGAEASLEHPDARTTQFRVPISGNPVTFTVWVYLEAGYSGTAPKLVVHQPGNTDVEDYATGTTGAWEQLSVSYTPNAAPLVLWIELVSDNTADPTAVACSVFWQELEGGPS